LGEAVLRGRGGVVTISIRIANRQKTLPVDRRRIRRVISAVLRDAGVSDAQISIAVVDDSTIAGLHGQFLDDPEPTDVLSFLLERSDCYLEGEVIASADTAKACAATYRSTPADELLRYLVHGTLHLVGRDDATPRQRTAMRNKERKYLGLG
jgi:probable rRNA maturation factor